MKNLIGIQFDNERISMAQSGEKGMLFHSERLPENLVLGEKILAPENLASILKKMKKDGGFRGANCVLVLPREAGYFRTAEMPVMTESQLKLNLPYEFRDFLGTETFRYNFDYAVESIDNDENGAPATMHLMAGAARKDLLDEYASVLKRAGLRLVSAIPMEMALLQLAGAAYRSAAAVRAADSGDTNPLECCVCHVGTDITMLAVFRDGKLTGSKTIDIGSDAVDTVIAERYGIDRYLAAAYRISDYENVLETVECAAVFDRLSLEVMKMVNFYRYENPDTKLDHIVFLGSSAWMRPLFLEEQTFAGLTRVDLGSWLHAEMEDEDTAEICALAIGALNENE